MPPLKKERPVTIEYIKNEFMPSIANLFETHAIRIDKRFQIIERDMFEMKDKFGLLKKEIVHEVTILIDNDKRLEIAVDMAKTATEQARVINDHSKRIGKLEVEVDLVKKAVKTANI